MKIEEALFFQWQQFCTCVPNQHQLALGWYFFGLTLLSGRKPDLCCTSIIENSKEKKLECPLTYTLKNAKTSLYHVYLYQEEVYFWNIAMRWRL